MGPLVIAIPIPTVMIAPFLSKGDHCTQNYQLYSVLRVASMAALKAAAARKSKAAETVNKDDEVDNVAVLAKGIKNDDVPAAGADFDVRNL
jgi:hypothetical protein